MAFVFVLCNSQLCDPGEGRKGQRDFCQATIEEKFGQIRKLSTGVWQRNRYGGCDDGSVLGHSSGSREGAHWEDMPLQESRVR